MHTLIILVNSNYIKKKLGCPILLHQQDLFLYNTLQQQDLMFGEEVDKKCDPLILTWNMANILGSDKPVFLKTQA